MSLLRFSRLTRAYGTVQSLPSAGTLPSRVPVALQEATAATAPRTNWTKDEVRQVYETPLNQLTYAAVRASRKRMDLKC